MIMHSSIYWCSADSTEIQRIVQYGIYPSKDTGIATRGECRHFLIVPAIFYPSCFFFLCGALSENWGRVLPSLAVASGDSRPHSADSAPAPGGRWPGRCWGFRIALTPGVPSAPQLPLEPPPTLGSPRKGSFARAERCVSSGLGRTGARPRLQRTGSPGGTGGDDIPGGERGAGGEEQTPSRQAAGFALDRGAHSRLQRDFILQRTGN